MYEGQLLNISPVFGRVSSALGQVKARVQQTCDNNLNSCWLEHKVSASAAVQGCRVDYAVYFASHPSTTYEHDPVHTGNSPSASESFAGRFSGPSSAQHLQRALPLLLLVEPFILPMTRRSPLSSSGDLLQNVLKTLFLFMIIPLLFRPRLLIMHLYLRSVNCY